MSSGDRPNFKLCLTCQEQGQKSKVRPDGGITRDLGTDEFYDEEGTHHIHYGKVRWGWRCSKGHVWTEDVQKKCPSCEFPNEPRKYDPPDCMCNYPAPCPNQDPKQELARRFRGMGMDRG
jgi:hypothetical protein